MGKSGTPSVTTNYVDEAYNSGLLDISQRQQGMAEDYFRFWQDNYADLERDQVNQQRTLIPGQTDIALQEQELLGTQLGNQLRLEPAKFDLAQQHLSGSSELLENADVNLDERAGVAATDVAASFAKQRQGLGRMGSPFRQGNALGDLNAAEALTSATAQTQARRQGSMDKQAMLGAALQNSSRTLGGA